MYPRLGTPDLNNRDPKANTTSPSFVRDSKLSAISFNAFQIYKASEVSPYRKKTITSILSY